jgi:hypothetical protein
MLNETSDRDRPTTRERLAASLGWTRASYTLMSVFVTVILLIVVVWWPMVEDYAGTFDPRYSIWVQFDWLLLGIFAVMSLLIMAGANLKADAWIVLVGLCGGLAIESWGTQTHLWTYFTFERPPLWIIPAWPIASLSIDRLVRFLQLAVGRFPGRLYKSLYWVIFPGFFAFMVYFVWPTLDKPLTWMALLGCAVLTLAPTDHRMAVLTFLAGTGLGYFLERWGTTRECWTYYTHQTPPLFAVFAHGLAAVAFWRVGKALESLRQMRGVRTLMRIKAKASD